MRNHAGSSFVTAFALLCMAGCSAEPSDFEKLKQKQQRGEVVAAVKEPSVEDQIADAKDQLRNGSPARALEAMRSMMVRYPERTDLIEIAAEALQRMSRTQEAVDLVLSIPIEQRRGDDEIALRAAIWWLDSGDYEAAIELLEDLVRRRPDNTKALHRLVELLNQSGRRVEAATHLQTLLRMDDVSERELFSMVTLGEAFIDESIPAPSFDRPTQMALSQARRYREDGELENAITLLKTLRESFPKSTQLAAFEGKVLAELHDWNALSAWRQDVPAGMEREPEHWFAIAQLSAHVGEHEASVRCFGETLKLDPTDREAVLGLARAFKLLGQPDASAIAMQAHEWLETTNQLASKFGKSSGTPAQYREMAETLRKLGRPWEAIGWQAIANAQTGDLPADRNRLAAWRSELESELDSNTSPVVMGLVDLSQWPLPTFDKATLTAPKPVDIGKEFATTPIRLEDVSRLVGLQFQYDNGDDMSDDEYALHQQTGGGIGVSDFDRDGWPDLYLVQSAGEPWKESGATSNELLRNLAGNHFASITTNASAGDRGYGQGVAVADLNQDGWPDLLVANIGVNVVLMNNGDGTFQRRALPNKNGNRWTSSIACGDLDGDHLPEIIEVNYIDDPAVFEITCFGGDDACGPSRFKPAEDRWLTIASRGQIEIWDGVPDPTVDPESTPDAGHGFAAIITNMDGKAGNDVYVTNDADANHLWVSRPSAPSSTRPPWALVENAALLGVATGQRGGRHGSMGLVLADFNRDGRGDLHVTNYWDQESDLYLQRPGELFQHATRQVRLSNATRSTVGWGTQAADFNRDGHMDLMVLNGHLMDDTKPGVPFEMLPQLFVGSSDQFRWDDPSSSDLVANIETRDPFWTTKTLGRTLAILDYNVDGHPDVIANHLDHPVQLLENRSDAGNWLRLDLVGTQSEREAIGTRVEVFAGDDRWTNWVVGGGGFLASNESTLDFGIAQHSTIDKISIQWPSGELQILTNVNVNQCHLIVEGQPTYSRK